MRSSDGKGRSIRSDALYPALSGEWEVPVTRNANVTPDCKMFSLQPGSKFWQNEPNAGDSSRMANDLAIRRFAAFWRLGRPVGLPLCQARMGVPAVFPLYYQRTRRPGEQSRGFGRKQRLHSIGHRLSFRNCRLAGPPYARRSQQTQRRLSFYSAATCAGLDLSLGLSSPASSQLSTLSDLTNLPTPSTSAQNRPSSMISSSLKCLARSA
jgi:hypothetical protein